MPWIESHTSLARHPKTLRLARILGIAVPAALGHLHLLWWWAIEYAPDGEVGRFDAGDLALACLWEGDETALLPALQRAGFVDTDGRIHDWHDYAGKLVDRRRRNAERMREDRAAHVADAPSINSESCEARAAHVQSEPDARVKLQNSTYRTVPNQPNQPNQTKEDRVAPDADAPDASRPNQPTAPLALSVLPTLPLGEQSEEPPVRATGTEPDEEPPSVTALRPGASDAPEAMTRPGPLHAPIEVPKPAGHPFGELWDAFDAVFGEARTRTEQSRRGRACKEARESHVGGDELLLAAQHWPNVMGDATMTELGIVANLGKLLHGPQVNGRSNGTVTAHTQHLRELATVNRGPKRGSAALDDDWRLSDHAEPGGE